MKIIIKKLTYLRCGKKQQKSFCYDFTLYCKPDIFQYFQTQKRHKQSIE